MYDIINSNESKIPELRLGKQLQKYPIMDLSVGESFQFPSKERFKISNAAARYKARHKDIGWDYVCRKVDKDICQIWRVS